MRKLIESALVSLDGVTGAPERSASFDAEDTALSLKELGNYDAFVMGLATALAHVPVHQPDQAPPARSPAMRRYVPAYEVMQEGDA